jgi:RNase H-fold protein (predicted Holliday junction resolvase)
VDDRPDGSAPAESPLVLAVDPGSDKCGLALVGPDGEVMRRAVVPRDAMLETVRSWIGENVTVLVGRGTGHTWVAEILAEANMSFRLVDERGTSMEARRLYWSACPPRGWRRLVPRGLLLPPQPTDDWAAVVIARRFLEKNKQSLAQAERRD